MNRIVYCLIFVLGSLVSGAETIHVYSTEIPWRSQKIATDTDKV
ncbi:hypothetical protein [uncultured Draconibacterium sp.]